LLHLNGVGPGCIEHPGIGSVCAVYSKSSDALRPPCRRAQHHFAWRAGITGKIKRGIRCRDPFARATAVLAYSRE